MNEFTQVGAYLEQIVITMPGGVQVSKEMAIHFIPDLEEPWLIMVGNKYGSVMLGEANGVYEGTGTTLKEALHDVMLKMEE